jgi:nitric oxide dioxygenase
VKSEDFVTVASAFLWTLENRLGESWDEETKEAWVVIYSALSNTMIDAVDKAQKSVLQ